MTREHVIPSFMYSFQKELESSVIGWNEVVEKMLPGELKVKDVCVKCNNTILGDLDSYGKSLLDHCGILVPNYTKLNIGLQYNFDLLTRWLLKISFNSSRTDGAHSHLFENLITYILGKSDTPSRSTLAVIAYLAAPERLGDRISPSEALAKYVGTSDRLNPFLVRICYGGLAGSTGYTLRLNIFGPLVFYMLLFDQYILPGHAASAVRQFLKMNRGAVELRPTRNIVELRAGERSWLDLYEHQITRVRQLKSARGG